jgi:hypothetical protein
VKRKTFDMVLTAGGGVLVVVLLAAGALGMWGYNFANSNVHNQLAEQQITFPPAAAFAHPVAGTEITPSMVGTVSKYAGQPLVTGQEAAVYANDFIAVHLREIGKGKTYAYWSGLALQQPKGSVAYTTDEGIAGTLFQGTTLRGLLLEAYAFGTFGQIALVASVVSFILAGIMLVLTLFGLLHFRRVPQDAEFPAVRTTARVPVPA